MKKSFNFTSIMNFYNNDKVTSPQPSPNLGEGAVVRAFAGEEWKEHVGWAFLPNRITSPVTLHSSQKPAPILTFPHRGRKFAFTLAEILITLAIIGVVAAMTMPTLIQNHQKRSLEVATQKFYSMMSQAVKQYMADEGVDDLRNTPLASDNYEDTASPEAIESIRNFVTKYLKVVEECDNDANNCFATVYKQFNGQKLPDYSSFTPFNGSRDYVLADGSIIRISYHLPINLYVDINGKKGPNRVGYDLWDMSIFYNGSIDEGELTPECKKDNTYCTSNYGSTPEEIIKAKYVFCQDGYYGGCFGHFLENNFKFDY